MNVFIGTDLGRNESTLHTEKNMNCDGLVADMVHL